MSRSARLRLSWALMGVVLVVALVVGATGDPGPRTSQERVYAIADTVKCPQCVGQTAAESDIQISREIRAEIARQVDAGRTDDEIREQLASAYGEEILLTPSSSGVTGLVWILPIVAAAGAVAGLVLVFRRWRVQGTATASREDRVLVDAALRARHTRDRSDIDPDIDTETDTEATER